MMAMRATRRFEIEVLCDVRRCQDDHRHARSPDPPLRHHRDRQHQLAIQKPKLTKPSPGPPPGLTHVGAQAPPTPSAPRNAEGAALRARVPPMHYADKPNPAIPEGSRLEAKRGSRLEAN